MSNEITLAVDGMQDTMTFATALFKSGLLPKDVDSTQKAFAIITLGQELGLKPWASLNGINVIQGKPSVSPQLMLALINRSGQFEDMVIDDQPTYCAVTMKRKGRSPYKYTFTLDDARAQGLTNKHTWKSMAPVLLKWRAVAGCARVVYPDVIQNLYTPEELGGEVNGDGELLMTPQPLVTEAPRQIAPPVVQQEPIPQYYDENGHDLLDAPDQTAPQHKFLGFSVAVETRIGKNGKCHDLILDNGARVTIYSREPLRNLSPLWADTVKSWDQPGTHAFLDIAGELDVYSTGKGYAFGIPDAFANLHAAPSDEVNS